MAGSPQLAVTWLNQVVRLRAEGCLTGCVQATVTGATAEVAWVIGTPWQGRGIAAEAAVGLVGGLLDGRLLGQSAVPVTTVVAHIHPAHAASAGVAAAAGLAPTDQWQDGEVKWALSAAD